MRSKIYQEIKKKIDPAKIYSLDEAIDFIKENKRKKFDETIETHISLSLPSSVKSFFGRVALPAGSCQKKKIVAFVTSKKAEEAKEAGADIVGGEELIEEIKTTGKTDFDEVVVEEEMMPKLVKIAKILGPKGLMPDPKKGTVTKEVALVIKKLREGQVFYRADKNNNLHLGLAKVSWNKEKIEVNIKAFLESVKKSRPSSVKGDFIRQVSICSSMGPGLKVALTD